ncbi:TlpA family protein disulfide reductase [Alteromonas sp. BL110]|uniref:TlpA family protein disulfide reductase n=1 Tax=Alteromonas sp. BL110 TaxID=1714845 RepID=UPI000E4C2043|nr:TlpA disulfide reductase family protein [Alteromonas sp. BL110]AXT40183.1 TlpA family protein disulfide reductase [Alteromonas sp. BL110]RKM79414.1 TlpA family protein disulfide reductase [Alteromonas sp. BL110]
MSFSLLNSNVGKTKPLLLIILFTIAALAGLFTYQSLQNDFETLDGEKYSWSGLKGQWVIVNYFAPWCAPCLREMPELALFHQSLPNDTQLFAINYDPKTKAELTAMIKKHDIAVPVVISSSDTKLPMDKPPYLPATFIVGPNGNIKDTIMGEVTAAKLRQRLSELKSAEQD